MKELYSDNFKIFQCADFIGARGRHGVVARGLGLEL